MEPSFPVLLVEDDPDDAFFMRRAFGAEGVGVTLYVATDGDEAIAWLGGEGRFADRATYPLPVHVLLDLKLPRRSGLEVLRWIRAHPTLHAVPVTVMSGSDLAPDVTEALTLGVADYIQKPVTLAGFDAAVRRLCGKL